jgi:ferritin-like metal-binding protein YciE
MAKKSKAANGSHKASAAKKTKGSSSNGTTSKNGTSEKKESGEAKSTESIGVAGLISNILHPFRTHKSLDDLYETGLNDAYSAEKQLIESLPLLEEAAENPQLKKAFSRHLKQTQRQAERLEKIFDKMGIRKTGDTCKAMEGLVAEANKIISEFQPGAVRDSALIIAAQKVEHYEIATYGSLAELSDVLGYTKAKNVLGLTLEEEEQTDELLSRIAMNVNDSALEACSDERK